MDAYNAVSLGGMLLLLGCAWALSKDRRRLNLRCIVAGVGLQLALAAVVFRAPGSRRLFHGVNEAVLKVLTAARAGQEFVFGPLASEQTAGGPILAFQALPLVIFFAALMGLLYYVRLMPLIIRGFAWVFTRLMRVSGAESLCAASNVFVGIESVTTVRPYLKGMTRSELCTILTAGMATVASSVLAVYVTYLQDVFGGIAGHLISASVLSAPAAIVMSKLVYPENERPETLGRTVAPHVDETSGAIDAIVQGAMAGVRLVVGIVALLIAFLGLLALADLALGGVAGWFGADLSLAKVLGYVFQPVAAAIGVPWSDAHLAGEMLGTRLVATEIPAYTQLSEAMKAGAFEHPRSPVIIAYGLCGFAHVASLAIFVGGTAALVPERRKELADVGPRALLAATLACLMTGAVAGTFFAP